MTKKEFIESVAEITGMSQKDTRLFLNASASVIVEALKNDDPVMLTSICKFVPVVKEECERISPRTGEYIISPKHRIIRFVPAANIKREVYEV